MKQRRGQWASNIGFILAAAGSAVGLGNIWKFPGKTGLYGGGAFLLCYVLMVFLVGMPVMMAELSIGRATQKNAVGAFRKLNRKWTFAGGIGVLTLFIIMSYYCVVGGWILKYVFTYLTGSGFLDGTVTCQDFFTGFITEPFEPLFWAFIFLIACIYVVAKGVSEGIERVSKVLMPVLFLLLVACVIRSVTLPGAMEGISYMLTIRPGSFNRDTMVAALGQAFFSLSVGMGIMITYGSYVPKDQNLVKSAAWICSIDTLVAFLAAFAIIPVVFATVGQDGLGMGGGFAFMALPRVFDGILGGQIFGLFFFALLFLAALTSAISILESCTAFITEEWGIPRLKAAILFSLPMTLFSAGYSLSQLGERSIRLPWFDFGNGIQMLPMCDVMEKFTDNLMIPLGALLFCIFTGWVWGGQKAADEISSGGLHAFRFRSVWIRLIQFFVPALIVMILYFTIGRGQGLS